LEHARFGVGWLRRGFQYRPNSSQSVVRRSAADSRNSITKPGNRDPLSMAEGSDEAFKREKFLYGVAARYAMSYGLWTRAVRTDFTV